MNNLNYEPESIIRQLKKDYKYTISYNKAWRAKRKTIEMSFGIYEVSYDNLLCTCSCRLTWKGAHSTSAFVSCV